MLSLPADTKNGAKCVATHGTMGHVDSNEPSTKRKPFAAILNHHFVQKVELILPEEIYEIVKQEFSTEHVIPAYSRVILPLGSLLEGEFFNEYIKRGNVLMLSEGRIGIDNVYSLREGVLTLLLDKEAYERAGIVGKPHGTKGKRGSKPRWVVKINLRLPSMLHGKRGFERIAYAFKNVLTVPVKWLFLDLGTKALPIDPLDAYFPTRKSVAPKISKDLSVKLPILAPSSELGPLCGAAFEEYAVDMHEWISMVLLESPRVNADDKIDAFLSRYSPPGDASTSCKLVKVTWQGFLSPSWAHKTFVRVLLSLPRGAWFVYSVDGLGDEQPQESKNCTILKLGNSPNEYVLWDIA